MKSLPHYNTVANFDKTNSTSTNPAKRNSLLDRIAFFNQKKPSNEPMKPRQSIKIDNSNIKKKLENMNKEFEKAQTARRRNTQSFKVENFSTNNVGRMTKEINDNDLKKKDEEQKKINELKEKKFVDNKFGINKFMDMLEEKEKEDKLKLKKNENNTQNSQNVTSIIEKINNNVGNTEKASDNINKNVKLQKLNQTFFQNLFGNKQQDLSEERKLHLFDRKINKYEIKEKIRYKIKLKNPNEKIQYESILYDEDGNIVKTSEKKDGKNEIVLFDNIEMDYNFTKATSITMVLIKYVDNNEVTRTKKVIPLKKIFHPEKKEYEEKIDNFTDDELLNIDYDEPKEKEDEKYIQLSFNIKNNKGKDNNMNSNISYTIQKNDEIIFKSAFCDSSNIKKTDKIPESILKPEFEISFYNEDFEETKIKVNYNDLFQGVEIKDFSDFNINVLPEIVKKNRLIKLIKSGLNLDLSIAIDFTCSNGSPNYSDSLHYIENGFVNNYEKAIRENYKIISTLNEKDKYDIYGFGADINGIFEKCFNLNMTDNPSIEGIENIISNYKNAVKSVDFSVGTYFAPVIDRINEVMKNIIYADFHYHILLIISDGLIGDIQDTIDSIIESSKYPLSIIIIGVGASVNNDMKRLNGESGKLISSSGEILKKDIVQYVHYNDYADDINKLTEAVLKYIPDQVSDYYANKIID